MKKSIILFVMFLIVINISYSANLTTVTESWTDNGLIAWDLFTQLETVSHINNPTTNQTMNGTIGTWYFGRVVTPGSATEDIYLQNSTIFVPYDERQIIMNIPDANGAGNFIVYHRFDTEQLSIYQNSQFSIDSLISGGGNYTFYIGVSTNDGSNSGNGNCYIISYSSVYNYINDNYCQGYSSVANVGNQYKNDAVQRIFFNFSQSSFDFPITNIDSIFIAQLLSVDPAGTQQIQYDNFTMYNVFYGINSLPEFNITTLGNQTFVCIDEFTTSNDYTFNISYFDDEGDNPYYFVDCDYQQSNVYIVDRFDELNYNLFNNGWFNGTCNYKTGYESSYNPSVLYFNSSTCTGNIRKRFKDIPINTTSELIFESGVYDSDEMIYSILDSDFNYAFSFKIYNNNTDYKYYYYVYNGSDYLQVAKLNVLYDNRYKIKFDFDNQLITFKTSRDSGKTFDSLGQYSFLNNNSNIQIIDFNPVSSFNDYPQWIDSIFFSYINPNIVYSIYQNQTLSCTYEVQGNTFVRTYFTDSEHLTDISNYEDIQVFTTSRDLCPQTVANYRDCLDCDYVNYKSLTGWFLTFDQMLWAIRVPYRFAKLYNQLNYYYLATFILLLITLITTLYFTHNLDKAIITGFIESMIFAILGFMYSDIWYLIVFLFCIYISRYFYPDTSAELGFSKQFVFFYMVLIVFIILNGWSYGYDNMFNSCIYYDEAAQVCNDNNLKISGINEVFLIFLKTFNTVINGLFFTFIPSEINYITTLIFYITNIYLWGARIIVFTELIKRAKDMIPIIS